MTRVVNFGVNVSVTMLLLLLWVIVNLRCLLLDNMDVNHGNS